jgi:hypothetical protein
MRWLTCFILASLPMTASALARIEPGDLLVSDQLGHVLVVDPVSGEREVLNELVTGIFLGLAQEEDGDVLATQPTPVIPGALAALVEISAPSGQERVVSEQLRNPFTLIFPIDVELDQAGEIFVLDAGPTPMPLEAEAGAVFQVADDGTGDGEGAQTLLAKNGDLLDVLQLAVHPNGIFYVTSLNTTLVCGGGMGTDPIGAVVAIDPSFPIAFDDDCANQAVLASAAQAGLEILLRSPAGVAVDSGDHLVVVSNGDPEVLGDESVVRLNALSGALLSTVSVGQFLCLPQQLAIEEDGNIVIADVGIGAVIRVDPNGPSDANQTLVSGPTLPCSLDPVVPGCGEGGNPSAFCPVGIAVARVPEPAANLLAAAALLTTTLLTTHRRPRGHN